MATPATSFLQLLAQAGQGAMEGYDYGQKQQLQRQELARQQAQDGMQRQLQMAQLAGYQRQADQAPLDAERQARMDAQATQDKQFEQAKGLLGLMLQGEQYDAANDFTQGNDALRRVAGLTPGQAGPVNMGFAAPPAPTAKATNPKTVVRTVNLGDRVQIFYADGTSTIQKKGAAPRLKPEPKPDPKATYAMITDEDGNVYAVNRSNPADKRLIIGANQ